MSLSAAEIRAAIEEAWRDSLPPRPDRITQTYDDEGVARYFAGRTWQGHDVANLQFHSVALSFFTPEAFCYYLPAFLLAALAGEAGGIYESLLFHLSPRQLSMQWSDSYRALIDGLTPAQRGAVGACLRACGARWLDDDRLDPEVEEIVAYLATGGAGTEAVELAESAEERLLRLARRPDRRPRDLTCLSLGNSKVTDADLAGLRAFSSLQELDLGGAKITSEGLAHLSAPAVAAALGNLEVLDLSGVKELGAEGLRHVAALRWLLALKLANTDLDDAGLGALAPLRLYRLNLIHARRLSAAGFGALDVSALEELAMFGVVAPDALLARLGAEGRLRSIECESMSESGLIALCRCAALANLRLGEAGAIGAAGLEALAGLPGLRTLSLRHLLCTHVPPGFPVLTELTLLSGSLDAGGGAGLAALPVLEHVGLFGVALSARALGALGRLRGLRRLTLHCKGLRDDLLRELAGSPVRQMSVHEGQLGSAALEVVAHLPALTELELDRVAVGDEGMQHLARAVGLVTLGLNSLPISDAGLAQLARCPTLRRLRIAGTGVSGAGLAALRQAAPGLKIVEG